MSAHMKKPAIYRLIVVELDDIVARRRHDRPNLLVAVSASDLDDRFARLQTGKGRPRWSAGHVVALRKDLGGDRTYVDLPAARRAERVLVEKLLRRGHTVNRRSPQRCVYVVELDSSHLSEPGAGFVYVGETSRTPEERFLQHRSDARTAEGRRLAASVVAKYGVRLRPDLAPSEFYLSKKEAEAAEAACAIELEKRGFVVRGAHTRPRPERRPRKRSADPGSV